MSRSTACAAHSSRRRHSHRGMATVTQGRGSELAASFLPLSRSCQQIPTRPHPPFSSSLSYFSLTPSSCSQGSPKGGFRENPRFFVFFFKAQIPPLCHQCRLCESRRGWSCDCNASAFLLMGVAVAPTQGDRWAALSWGSSQSSIYWHPLCWLLEAGGQREGKGTCLFLNPRCSD